MWHWLDGYMIVGAALVIVAMAAFQRRSPRQCPRCREENRESAVFCAQCGERLPGR